MRHAISTLFVLSAFASTALAQPYGDEWIRFFLDTKGISEAEARPADDPLSFANPTITGSGRLYLYFEFGQQDVALGAQDMMSFNIRLDIDGPATFTNGLYYNIVVGGLQRWQYIPTSSPQSGSTSWWIGSLLKWPGGSGTRNIPDFETVQAQDRHFRCDDGSPFGTTLLGFIDVAHGGGAETATIKYSNGDSGQSGVTVTAGDTVYFGFGDAGTQNKAGRTSAEPDAFIAPVPEPATILLAMASALLLRKRG